MRNIVAVALCLCLSVTAHAQVVTGGSGNPTSASAWNALKNYKSLLSPTNVTSMSISVDGSGNLVDTSTGFINQALNSMGISQAQGWEFSVQNLQGFYSYDKYAACAGTDQVAWPPYNEGPVSASVPPIGAGQIQGGMELGVTYHGWDPNSPKQTDSTTHWMLYCATNSESVAQALSGTFYFRNATTGRCYFIWNKGVWQNPFFDTLPFANVGDQFHQALAVGGTPSFTTQWYLYVYALRAWDDLDPITGNLELHVSMTGAQSGFLLLYTN